MREGERCPSLDNDKYLYWRADVLAGGAPVELVSTGAL